MKLARFGPVDHERPAVLTEDGQVLDASGVVPDYDPAFFASSGLVRLAVAVAEDKLPSLDTTRVRIGPPLKAPQKVVCIGLNYRDHARETGAELPEEPVVFMKAPNTSDRPA